MLKTKPCIAVLYAPGTNCHEETAFAVNLAGGTGRVVLLSDLISKEDSLLNYSALIIPGGFSWGDHLGAGRIFGVHMISLLKDQLSEFLEAKRPLLGICNGYQVLAETGILPAGRLGNRSVALLQNASARFESRWVELLVGGVNCIWIAGLQRQILRMPVGHGEGRIHLPGASIYPALFYSKDGNATTEYPWNPSGSLLGVAGITDPTGLVLGLMPHPERAVSPWHGSTDGLLIFENLIVHLKSS